MAILYIFYVNFIFTIKFITAHYSMRGYIENQGELVKNPFLPLRHYY